MFAPRLVRPSARAAAGPRATLPPPRVVHPGPAWDFSRVPVRQAKLTVGSASDPLEHEADRAAAAVMDMAEPTALTAAPPRISRRCAACDDDEVKAKRGVDAAGGPAPASVAAVLASGGAPLDAASRAFFEPRFGRDFSGVRIHAGSEAAASARAIGARAYTAGADIVLAAGEYAPESPAGRRLIAHELAHVAQQGRAGVVRRDFLTPVPDLPPHAEPKLTAAEVATAIAFNAAAFRGGNVGTIQTLLGQTPTGRFTADDVNAVASLQAEYGLKPDGMIGGATLRLLSNEQRLEGAGTGDAACLTFFQATPFPVTGGAAGGTAQLRGHHRVEAHFSARCACAQFQYRQFIEGRATVTRGGAVQDMASSFTHIPGGLPASFGPDGKTQCPTNPIYGDRTAPGEASSGTTCPQDRYTNAAGGVDQAGGCDYRAEDFPVLTVPGLISGDRMALLVRFRGEIQRSGRVVQTRTWTTVDNNVLIP